MAVDATMIEIVAKPLINRDFGGVLFLWGLGGGEKGVRVRRGESLNKDSPIDDFAPTPPQGHSSGGPTLNSTTLKVINPICVHANLQFNKFEINIFLVCNLLSSFK